MKDDKKRSIQEQYLAARLKKIVAETAIKNEQKEIERIKKEKLMGGLISLKEAQEAFVDIGAKTKARMTRLIAELPPKLEGLQATDMIPIIRTFINEACLDLFTEHSALKEVEVSQEYLETVNVEESNDDDEDDILE